MGPLAADHHLHRLGHRGRGGTPAFDRSGIHVPHASAQDRCYRYASVESDVGRLLVVMSDEGLVDVIRGETQGEVLRRAAGRYPWGCFTPDDGSHDAWVEGVVERFAQPTGAEVVPLRRVNQRVRRIAS
jgi:hypothetical protein